MRYSQSWSSQATRMALMKSTPTIAEFFQEERLFILTSPANGTSATSPQSYPIEHGFDEMKEVAAYYPGVYTYD